MKNKLMWSVPSRGFGMVELLVSISIMTIVSAIILARQNSFNGAVLLRSEAYEIALRIREVQLSAVSAINRGSGSDDFRSVLGVYFSSEDGRNETYPVFRDSNVSPNNDYFYQTEERFGEQGRIDQRFEIREIRVGGSVETDVSVVFERPNFDASFFTSSGNEANVDSVEIDISPKGDTGTGNANVRTIEVTSTGQIGVI
jgi:prepilin-type N-terminal cleavage/methylation domain-containing protein